MSDHLTIETPEQIPLEFPLAGIGSRFLALAVDSIVQGLVSFTLFMTYLMALTGMKGRWKGGGAWGLALLVVAGFLLQFGYFAFFEAIWNGQTPGKRYLHLRVIKESGRPITAYEAITRNLLRIVDFMPSMYAAGIVSALLSSKNKRLGDYVAGTVVVHERPLDEQAPLDTAARKPQAAPATVRPTGSILNLNPALPARVAPPAEPAPMRTGLYDVSRLSPQEFELIEAFLLRRGQLAPSVRSQMARQIADRIAAKLEVSEEDQRAAERLLEALATEYRNRARFR